MEDPERRKFEQRIGVDRRKKKFGRRGPKLLLSIANWLTSNPNAFYIYLIGSMFALLYSIANLAYNLNDLIFVFWRGLTK